MWKSMSRSMHATIASLEKGERVRRYLVLVTALLITAVFLAVGCGGSSGESATISGKYVYRDAPAGQAPVYDFQSDGTVVITVPANVDWKSDPQAEERKITWYFKTSIKDGTDTAELWEEKKAMTSDNPDISFTIYKDGLVDTQDRALVKEGTTLKETPSSSVPATTP